MSLVVTLSVLGTCRLTHCSRRVVYFVNILRKEVIQPQVPLRLPCYDLVPIRGFVFGGCPLAVGAPTSDAPPFRGLTGGVYKAQEHIHRGVADPRLLAIPASRRRVAAYDLNWAVIFAISFLSQGRVALLYGIVARVQPWT